MVYSVPSVPKLVVDSVPSVPKFTGSNDSFIHSFISAISTALLQVLYYAEALPTTAR